MSQCWLKSPDMPAINSSYGSVYSTLCVCVYIYEGYATLFFPLDLKPYMETNRHQKLHGSSPDRFLLCVHMCVCVSFCVVVYTNLRGPWVKAIISKVQWVGIKYHSPARGGLVQFRCDNNSWQKIRLSLEGWNPVCHALKCMCLILFSENVMGPVLPKMNIYHIIVPPLLSPGLLLFFNMSLNSKVWKWKTGELSARRNEKRKLLKPPLLFSLPHLFLPSPPLWGMFWGPAHILFAQCIPAGSLFMSIFLLIRVRLPPVTHSLLLWVKEPTCDAGLVCLCTCASLCVCLLESGAFVPGQVYHQLIWLNDSLTW